MIATPADFSVKRSQLVVIHGAATEPLCARVNSIGLLPSGFDTHTSASERLEFHVMVDVQRSLPHGIVHGFGLAPMEPDGGGSTLMDQSGVAPLSHDIPSFTILHCIWYVPAQAGACTQKLKATSWPGPTSCGIATRLVL
ncbi:hypothetical protein JI752_018750 [Lysobacter sp. MMG2]|nr:hypothetical protein [Lysobacter sp. MMG2]